MATLSETIQEGLNKMAGIAIARQDPAQALMVATLSSIASMVSQLEYNVFYYRRKAEELEKAVGTIPVATYADLVAYANPVKDTFFSVTADEQNNGGNASIYMKNAAGEIIWFAAQKMN